MTLASPAQPSAPAPPELALKLVLERPRRPWDRRLTSVRFQNVYQAFEGFP